MNIKPGKEESDSDAGRRHPPGPPRPRRAREPDVRAVLERGLPALARRLRQGRRRHASGSQQLDLTTRWRTGLAAAGAWYVGFCGGESRTVCQNRCLTRTVQCRIPHAPGEESHQACGIRAETWSSDDGADAEQLAEPSALVTAQTVASKLADHHACNS